MSSKEKEKDKDGLRFTASTKVAPTNDTLQTSSTRGMVTNSIDNDHANTSTDDNNHGVTFHNTKNNNSKKFSVVYWRNGLSLPESGHLLLTNTSTLTFKGMVGTKLSFNLDDVDLKKTARMGGLLQDAFTILTKDGDKYLFSTVLKDRKKVIQTLTTAIANVKLEKEEKTFDATSNKKKKKTKFRMPPDETLGKMNIIAERKLKGVSLDDYVEIAWSEGHNCDKSPMYQPFLEKQGKDNVSVSEWKEGDCTGKWCDEQYSKQREVTFNFYKQTIGKTLVDVKHTQMMRRNDSDQCCVQIKMAMSGFPYADCFVVEVRHVASRVGDNDLQIQIGMFVRFLKSCMFENKIRTNTGAETTKAQLALLEMIVQECAKYATIVDDASDESDDEAEMEEKTQKVEGAAVQTRRPFQLPNVIVVAVVTILRAFLTVLRPFVRVESLEPLFQLTSIDEAVQSTRNRIEELEEISLKSVAERRRKDVSREIASMEKSVSRIETLVANSTHS